MGKKPPLRGISGTRALKNVRLLQKAAPQLMPTAEPPSGFADIIPVKVLAHLHQRDKWGAIGVKDSLAKKLKNVQFPNVSPSVGDPLFQGTMYFVQVQFTIQDQNNTVISISAADMATIVQYATLAAGPISAYATEYGSNSISIDPTVISYPVTLPTASYTGAQLAGWVNDIASKNNLPSSACVVMMNPSTVTNTRFGPNVTGYHDLANLPYIFANVFGQSLTIADQAFVYAQTLSHEMAETVVDPLVDGKNPEVCDGCAGNCNNLWLAYFDDNGKYVTTSQNLLPTTSYKYYINAVVLPNYAAACPTGTNKEAACNYAPPLRRPVINPVAHERNAAWLIELWLLIHGGDPPAGDFGQLNPEMGLLSTVRAIAGLAHCLGDAQAEKEIIGTLKTFAERVSLSLRNKL